MEIPSMLRGKILELSIPILLLSASWTVFGKNELETSDRAVAPPMEFYDTNKDGYISAEEAAAQGMSPRIFRSLDTDHDGRLNQDEFSKMPPLRADEK
jgi:Ca2+-binding EF-hand superfamily protein